MTVLTTYAADQGRDGKCNNLARPGHERSRKPAHSRFEHQHTERGDFRAICNGEGFRVRATGIAIIKTETKSRNSTVRLPAIFRSAVRTVDASGLRGFVLPTFRRWRNFVGRILRAVRTRLSHGNTRVKFLQEPSRRFANPFHFNLSASVRGLAALLDGHQQSRRKLGNVRKAVGEIRNVER